MTFLCHQKESFPGLRPNTILSLFLDQFQEEVNIKLPISVSGFIVISF